MPSSDAQTHLQITIAALLASAPRKREYYDRLIQQRTGKTGKILYDIQRGKIRQPAAERFALIADIFDVPLVTLVNPNPWA